MIKFITVWILTVNYVNYFSKGSGASSYQLQYASQSTCERQRKYHETDDASTRCDFAQIPVVIK